MDIKIYGKYMYTDVYFISVISINKGKFLGERKQIFFSVIFHRRKLHRNLKKKKFHSACIINIHSRYLTKVYIFHKIWSFALATYILCDIFTSICITLFIKVLNIKIMHMCRQNNMSVRIKVVFFVYLFSPSFFL